MNKFCKIVLIVAGVSAILGGALLLGGKAMGGTPKFSVNLISSGQKIVTEKDIVTGEIPVKDFDSILLDTASVDVKICKGNERKVTYSVPEDYIPEVSVDNKKLHVKQPNVIGGITCSFTTNQYLGYTIYITDNDEYSADLNSASGEITVDGVNISGKVSVASGDVIINNANSNSIDFSYASAVMTINNSNILKASFSGSSGDINVKNSNFQNVDISVASGETTFEKSSIADFISVASSSGDIILSLEKCGSVKTDSASGEVDLKLPGKMDDYSFNVNTTSGEINVGGVEGDRKLSLNSSSSKSIVCESTSGDVSVSFAK